MTENQQDQSIGPVKAADLGPLLAWDTDRCWGNTVQVFVNPDHALFILREQVHLAVGEADGEPTLASKNVSSWVIPVEVAMQLRDVLNSLDFLAVGHGKPSE